MNCRIDVRQVLEALISPFSSHPLLSQHALLCCGRADVEGFVVRGNIIHDVPFQRCQPLLLLSRILDEDAEEQCFGDAGIRSSI